MSWPFHRKLFELALQIQVFGVDGKTTPKPNWMTILASSEPQTRSRPNILDPHYSSERDSPNQKDVASQLNRRSRFLRKIHCSH